MSDNEICRRVLEQILNISIKKVEYPITQKTIDLLLDGKGIRLDVYVNDDKDTVYNVEMQRIKIKDLPKRARYYQGNIDLDLIGAGRPYEDLRKTYIIFICTFDFFNQGRNVYTFENICMEDKEVKLEDGTTKIFLNTKGSVGEIDRSVKAFLQYVNGVSSEDRLVQEIEQEIEKVRREEGEKVNYMTFAMKMMEERKEGFREGKLEGIAEGERKGRAEGGAKDVPRANIKAGRKPSR